MMRDELYGFYILLDCKLVEVGPKHIQVGQHDSQTFEQVLGRPIGISSRVGITFAQGTLKAGLFVYVCIGSIHSLGSVS